VHQTGELAADGRFGELNHRDLIRAVLQSQMFNQLLQIVPIRLQGAKGSAPLNLLAAEKTIDPVDQQNRVFARRYHDQEAPFTLRGRLLRQLEQ